MRYNRALVSVYRLPFYNVAATTAMLLLAVIPPCKLRPDLETWPVLQSTLIIRLQNLRRWTPRFTIMILQIVFILLHCHHRCHHVAIHIAARKPDTEWN
jgi:hypothetical protein